MMRKVTGNFSKQLMLSVFALALLIAGVQPAMAIHEGELDGENHPYVGIMVAKAGDGRPMWRCSGALLSEKLFLTAGHCTHGAASVSIWFDADIDAGMEDNDRDGFPDNGFPWVGQTEGTPYTHPLYEQATFYLYDLGVVVLDDDKTMEMNEYADLPELDILDGMATGRGRQDVTFTTVGYGFQEINPVFIESALVRMVAYPHLVQINTGYTGDYSVMLSNNHSTGGQCYGDSGGPNFIGDSNVIGGVVSFGNNNCVGTGGVYRVDRYDDLVWLYTVFGVGDRINLE